MELASPRDRFAADLAARARALDAPADEGAYVVPNAGLVAAFALVAALGLLTPNPLLTAASVLVLPLFMGLLWRRGEPPILLFAVSFQWLQVTAKVYQANSAGLTVEALSGKPAMGGVILLALAGLVVLAAGMRLMLRRLGPSRLAAATEEIARVRPSRAFWLYVVLAIGAEVIDQFASSAGGLRQLLGATMGLRWAGLFLFAYAVLHHKKQRLLLVLVTAFEILNGIGFFSGFKTPVFVLLIAYGTVRYQIRPSSVLAGAVLIVALFYAGSAWTAVKSDFRSFLNQGSGQQQNVHNQTQTILGLAERVLSLTHREVMEASDALLRRIAYVDYFAAVVEYVPTARPHGGGEIWGAALMHTLMPRLFFPNKPPLPSDSELTMAWTGYHMASGEQGTSISIGYMGESYADFGPWGMFVPVLLVGMMWGFMYAWFVGRAPLAIIGFGFAVAMLIGAYQFEMASIKLLGGTVSRFLVLALLLHLVGDRMGRWLMQAEPEAEAGAAPAPLGHTSLGASPA